MSTIRLYFDVDSMERAVVVGLRARGVDATTALEAGTTTLTDLEQLEFAHSESRVLFSFNGCDFLESMPSCCRKEGHTPVSFWRRSSVIPSASECAAS